MTKTTRRPRPNRRLIGGVFAFVALVAFIAVVATDGDEPTVEEAARLETGVVTVSGQALPPLPKSGADPATGTVAPSVLSERRGDVATIEPETLEQPTMVVFLAHWCPHCQSEVPRLVDLAENGTFTGVRTIAVLTATDPARPNHPPSDWLDREDWHGERLFDDEAATAAAAYGVTSFPFTVYLDADGAVFHRSAGEQTPAQITDAIEAITAAAVAP